MVVFCSAHQLFFPVPSMAGSSKLLLVVEEHFLGERSSSEGANLRKLIFPVYHLFIILPVSVTRTARDWLLREKSLIRKLLSHSGGC